MQSSYSCIANQRIVLPLKSSARKSAGARFYTVIRPPSPFADDSPTTNPVVDNATIDPRLLHMADWTFPGRETLIVSEYDAADVDATPPSPVFAEPSLDRYSYTTYRPPPPSISPALSIPSLSSSGTSTNDSSSPYTPPVVVAGSQSFKRKANEAGIDETGTGLPTRSAGALQLNLGPWASTSSSSSSRSAAYSPTLRAMGAPNFVSPLAPSPSNASSDPDDAPLARDTLHDMPEIAEFLANIESMTGKILCPLPACAGKTQTFTRSTWKRHAYTALPNGHFVDIALPFYKSGVITPEDLTLSLLIAQSSRFELSTSAPQKGGQVRRETLALTPAEQTALRKLTSRAHMFTSAKAYERDGVPEMLQVLKPIIPRLVENGICPQCGTYFGRLYEHIPRAHKASGGTKSAEGGMARIANPEKKKRKTSH